MASIYALLLACWFWKVSGHQPATFIDFAQEVISFIWYQTENDPILSLLS
jgi:hypothetical protein